MSTDKKRVLVVDDSPEDIQIVMENLKDEYAILVATNGQKGLKIASSEPKPDVILMDVMMPEMDGYEVYRKLKENPVTQDIAVIFVSAHDTVEEKLAGYDAGGSDYLIKPVQPTELLEKIKLAINNTQIQNQVMSDKDEAFQMAMTAMTSAGEQGVVLEFLRQSFTVNRIEKLAELIVDAIAKHELLNTVQIRSGDRVINVGTTLPVPPLEAELLMRIKDFDRMKDHGKRAIFNFGGISLLIKNVSEDNDKWGRFRDHIAILLEGAESKLTSLEMGENLAELVVDANQALEEIESEQMAHKEKSQQFVEKMMQDLEESFIPWGLTEEQENRLIKLVQNCIDTSLDHLKQGIAIDEKMREIINRLQHFN
jgi:CheY-like chemotaxis protein